MVITTRTDNHKHWEEYGETETLIPFWQECKLVETHWETMAVSTKAEHTPQDPTILLLVIMYIYPPNYRYHIMLAFLSILSY